MHDRNVRECCPKGSCPQGSRRQVVCVAPSRLAGALGADGARRSNDWIVRGPRGATITSLLDAGPSPSSCFHSTISDSSARSSTHTSHHDNLAEWATAAAARKLAANVPKFACHWLDCRSVRLGGLVCVSQKFGPVATRKQRRQGCRL